MSFVDCPVNAAAYLGNVSAADPRAAHNLARRIENRPVMHSHIRVPLTRWEGLDCLRPLGICGSDTHTRCRMPTRAPRPWSAADRVAAGGADAFV